MVLYDFESTTVWRAFFLNSLATTIAIAAAILIKKHVTKYVDKNGNDIQDVTPSGDMVMTILVTFIASFVSYALLHILFNFGGGMLVNTTN